MPRKGENIYKRKDGRWEGRYIGCYDENHKAKYGYDPGRLLLQLFQYPSARIVCEVSDQYLF